jgi:hypothetical protein
MNTSAKLCLRIYAITLNLYPVAFRKRYADEMIEAARLQAAKTRSTTRLVASFFWDMLRSLPPAHWRYVTPVSPSVAIAILLVCNAPYAFLAISDQLKSRRMADYVPASIAGQYSNATSAPSCAKYAPGCTAWYAHRLAGQHPQEISSLSWLHSGLAFITIYDSTGHALGGDATLNGKWPQPPQSIFDTIRRRGEEHVTWQPQPGVRIALVGRTLASGGFVFSGESLLQSEAEHARYLRGMFSSWLIVFVFSTPVTVIRLLARRRRSTIP